MAACSIFSITDPSTRVCSSGSEKLGQVLALRGKVWLHRESPRSFRTSRRILRRRQYGAEFVCRFRPIRRKTKGSEFLKLRSDAIRGLPDPFLRLEHSQWLSDTL